MAASGASLVGYTVYNNFFAEEETQQRPHVQFDQVQANDEQDFSQSSTLNAEDLIALENHVRLQLEQKFLARKQELEQILSQERQKLEESKKNLKEEYQNRVEEEINSWESAIRQEQQNLQIQYHESLLASYDELSRQLEIELENYQQIATQNISDKLLDIKVAIYNKQTRLRNMRAQIIASLESQLTHLTEQYHSVLNKESEMSEAQKITLSFFSLLAAAENSTPFEKQLDQLKNLTKTWPSLSLALEGIPLVAAKNGVPTMSKLASDFQELLPAARKQAYAPQELDMWERGVGRIVEFCTFPVRGYVEGSDPDAVLARAEYYVWNDNFDKAVAEISSLPRGAKSVFSAWIDEAANRIRSQRALERIRQAVYEHLQL